MPHADNAPRLATWRPHKYHKPYVQPPDRDETRLAVIISVVFTGQVQSRKDLLGSQHIETADAQRPLALYRIASDAHRLIVATVISKVKRGESLQTAG
jgi:hypothetical protein